MMRQKNDLPEWQGTKILGLFVVIAAGFFGISIFTLTDGISNTSDVEVTQLCNDGLCYIPTINTLPVGAFVQLDAELESDNTIIQTSETFTNLKLQKNKIKNYEINENTAILFAAKDSFLRESIKNTNEGGNDVLRIMGTGSTNNRALIAFDQTDLEEIVVDKILASAKLRLFVVSNDEKWESEQNLNLYRISENWNEGNSANAPFGSFVGAQNGATWNCSSTTECDNWNGGQFSEYATDIVTITNDINGQWIEFDVTDDIQSFLDDTENNGWIIMKADEDSPGRINFAARESSINGPQLELTFT